MYYPGYAWILVDNFAQWEWWTVDNSRGHDKVNCTKSQFETVLNHSITALALPADFEEEDIQEAKVEYEAFLAS